MITFRHRGNFNNTERFLNRAKKLDMMRIADTYGKRGVQALSDATPIDSGLTAASWKYTIQFTHRGLTLTWLNTNEENGAPVAILIQYGHGTRNGGYVPGRDYINPAITPILDELADALWKEVREL